MQLSQQDRQKYLEYVDRKMLSSLPKASDSQNDDNVFHWCINDIKTQMESKSLSIQEDRITQGLVAAMLESLLDYLEERDSNTSIEENLATISEPEAFWDEVSNIIADDEKAGMSILAGLILGYRTICQIYELQASDYPEITMENHILYVNNLITNLLTH